MSGTVVVFSGGNALSRSEIERLPRDATVIAADSGVDRAHDAGFHVDLAIGDFDSVSARGLARAESQGAEVRRFATGKDQTDLELAIDAAVAAEPDRIVFAALAGGRADHEVAALLGLAGPARLGIEVDAVLPTADLSVVVDRRTFTGRVGDLLSLVPVGGDVVGVETSGLEYPLLDETLAAGTARGISNVFTAPLAVVSVTAGVLYGFRPLDGTSMA